MQAVRVAGGLVPLAARLGVHPRTVRRWHIEGALPVRTARRIERLLGVRIHGSEQDHGGIEVLRDAFRDGWTITTLSGAVGVQANTMRLWIKRRTIPARKERMIKKLIYGVDLD